jgi:hypothetical protein
MTTPDPRLVLGDVSGGRVLDVATGDGAFIRFLLDGLRDHGEIVGIDSNGARAEAFTEALGDRPGVRFVPMDARALAFPYADPHNRRRARISRRPPTGTSRSPKDHRSSSPAARSSAPASARSGSVTRRSSWRSGGSEPTATSGGRVPAPSRRGS